MFYQLFHNKETYELKIQPLTKIFKKDKNLTKRISELGENDVFNYNDYYVFANNRKILVSYALAYKKEWLQEQEDIINKIKNIKI